MSKKSDYWANHLDAIKSSGLSTVEYARKHGLDAQSIYRWRNRFKTDGSNKVKQNKSTTTVSKATPKQYTPANRFVSLQIEQRQPVTNNTTCTIRFGDNVSLDLYSLPDVRWLADVIRTIRNQ